MGRGVTKKILDALTSHARSGRARTSRQDAEQARGVKNRTRKIRLTNKHLNEVLIAVKLLRTDTTLDLSQKARKDGQKTADLTRTTPISSWGALKWLRMGERVGQQEEAKRKGATEVLRTLFQTSFKKACLVRVGDPSSPEVRSPCSAEGLRLEGRSSHFSIQVSYLLAKILTRSQARLQKSYNLWRPREERRRVGASARCQLE